jgi:diadenosine tetraphosphatase ApaH/serine/threonine PP2A family protein phosphatase
VAGQGHQALARLRIVGVAATAGALAACGSGSGSTAATTTARPARTTTSASTLRATLSAPTHTPKANVKWRYAVHATRGGTPVRARLTAQIVDPIGGAHPVLYANTKRKLVNWPFRGTFRDYVIWPGSSRGIPLTFRVTVVSGGARRVLRYRVTPR